MPALSRLYDVSIGTGSHGLPCCPHTIVGFRISGSPTVLSNGRGVSRVQDLGFHSCPHCSTNQCIQGSATVFADGRGLHRVGDQLTEFCGVGYTLTGSPDDFANGGA